MGFHDDFLNSWCDFNDCLVGLHVKMSHIISWDEPDLSICWICWSWNIIRMQREFTIKNCIFCLFYHQLNLWIYPQWLAASELEVMAKETCSMMYRTKNGDVRLCKVLKYQRVASKMGASLAWNDTKWVCWCVKHPKVMDLSLRNDGCWGGPSTFHWNQLSRKIKSHHWLMADGKCVWKVHPSWDQQA